MLFAGDIDLDLDWLFCARGVVVHEHPIGYCQRALLKSAGSSVFVILECRSTSVDLRDSELE